jgi:predicted DNA-binding transcriptional regulator AlpA
MSTDVQKQKLAISAFELAELLGVSLRHIRRQQASEQLPRPLRLGKSVRWSVEEIKNWIEAGGPNRKEWETIKG